jgi:hypothetical protein
MTHKSAEIFSFAALPWEGVSEIEAMNRMRNVEKLPRPDDCPEEIYCGLLLECWKLDTKKRVSADLIVATLTAYIVDPRNELRSLDSLTWPEMQVTDTHELIPVNALVDIKNDALVAKFASMEVDRKRLDLQRELGRGQFGSVLLGTLQEDDGTKINVAVKAMHQQGVPDAESQHFEYEARLLVALEHPHIIRAIGVCFQTSPQLLVLELMGGGDLKKYLKDHQSELESTASTLGRACVQIAGAMEYLERKRVVHRDLAARYDSLFA